MNVSNAAAWNQKKTNKYLQNVAFLLTWNVHRTEFEERVANLEKLMLRHEKVFFLLMDWKKKQNSFLPPYFNSLFCPISIEVWKFFFSPRNAEKEDAMMIG